MSNFICEKCGMTNIDCGYQGYKTEREIELEKQLDREIKINRKMKSVLEKYADEKNWDSYGNDWKFGVYKDENDDYPEYTDKKLAQEVLKEIDNKE